MNVFEERWGCGECNATGKVQEPEECKGITCPFCNGTGITGTLDEWLMDVIGSLWIASSSTNQPYEESEWPCDYLQKAYSHLLRIAEHLGVEGESLKVSGERGILDVIGFVVELKNRFDKTDYSIAKAYLKAYAKSQGIELEE